jgi:hypothetical protein
MCAILLLARFLLQGTRAFEQFFQEEFQELNWFMPTSSQPVPLVVPPRRTAELAVQSSEEKIHRLQSPIPLVIEEDKVHLPSSKFMEEIGWLIALFDEGRGAPRQQILQKIHSLIRVYSRLAAIRPSQRPSGLREDEEVSRAQEGIHLCGFDAHSFKVLALFEAHYWTELEALSDPYDFYQEAFDLIHTLADETVADLFHLSKPTILRGLNEVFWGKLPRWYPSIMGDHLKLGQEETTKWRTPSTWREIKGETLGDHFEMAILAVRNTTSLFPVPQNPRMLDLLELAHLLWIAASDPTLPNNQHMKLAILDAMMQSLYTYGTQLPSCKQGTQNRLALALQHLHPLATSLSQPWTPSQFWSHFSMVADAENFMLKLQHKAHIWLSQEAPSFAWTDMSSHLGRAFSESLPSLPFAAALQFLLELDDTGRQSVKDYLSGLLERRKHMPREIIFKPQS